MEQTQEQQGNSKVPQQLRKYVFKRGISGNPGGRPVGSKSMKQYAKEYLETLPEEDRIEFLNSVDHKTIWEMAESKPSQGIGQAEDLKELHINLIKFDDNSDTTPQPTT